MLVLREHLARRARVLGAHEQQDAEVDAQLRDRGRGREHDRVVGGHEELVEQARRAVRGDALRAPALVEQVQRAEAQLGQLGHRGRAVRLELQRRDLGRAQQRGRDVVREQEGVVDVRVAHRADRLGRRVGLEHERHALPHRVLHRRAVAPRTTRPPRNPRIAARSVPRNFRLRHVRRARAQPQVPAGVLALGKGGRVRFGEAQPVLGRHAVAPLRKRPLRRGDGGLPQGGPARVERADARQPRARARHRPGRVQRLPAALGGSAQDAGDGVQLPAGRGAGRRPGGRRGQGARRPQGAPQAEEDGVRGAPKGVARRRRRRRQGLRRI
ncbi:MAG: hypothetical protein CL844_03550 [Crocinitomicaceae bacterium]|nr:hypothetical protein [Crocinitomicaceae bacterium]